MSDLLAELLIESLTMRIVGLVRHLTRSVRSSSGVCGLSSGKGGMVITMLAPLTLTYCLVWRYD